MIDQYILVFIICCILMFYSGKLLIESLARIARFLEWKEFVVAFFIIAIAGTIPSFFIGITSALRKIPELSFGDIVGGNILDLTVVISSAVLITKGISSKTKMIQISSLFTVAAAVLPLFLILDGILGRGDGIILISVFTFYVFWLFSKKERFSKIYEENDCSGIKEFKTFIKDIIKTVSGIILLLIAAQGIVFSAHLFAKNFNLPLSFIGMFIIGAGNALPEIYFSIISARKEKTGMILGNLMGSVIVSATLVLGIVALICPIKINDFSSFAIARFFLIISSLFFFFFVKTGRRITKREALFLLGIYFTFILCEIFLDKF